jgi:hypothetical protein
MAYQALIKAAPAAIALVLVAGCASGTRTPPAALSTTVAAASASPSTSPSTAPSSAPLVDEDAIQMCKELATAKRLDAKGLHEKPAEGFTVSTDSMNAQSARIKAQILALKTKVVKIRAIALHSVNAGKPINVPNLQAWCRAHQ